MREALFLALLLAFCFPLWGLVWQWQFAAGTWQPFVVASVVCASCGCLALIIQDLAHRLENGFAGSLLSIFIRTLGPLLATIIIAEKFPQMVADRIFPAFVGCYLLTLTGETILSVRLIGRWEKIAQASPDELNV